MRYFSSNHFSVRPLQSVRSLGKAATGLALAAGMTIAASAAFAAEATQGSIAKAVSLKQTASVEQTVSTEQTSAEQTSAEQTSAEQTSAEQPASVEQITSQPLANGVYLYGQSPEAEQLGSAYMVFEVRDRQITGAFYMPHSSFDCFSGAIEANRLALNVIDSYEQASYPYEIGLEQSDAVATVGDVTITPVQIEGFHRIDEVSENDQRILASCQANLQ